MSNDLVSAEELSTMMSAVARDWDSWFNMGEFRCRKTLANGAVVSVRIKMPALPEPGVAGPVQDRPVDYQAAVDAGAHDEEGS